MGSASVAASCSYEMLGSLQCRHFPRVRVNGFNRESAMLKLPKRGGNGASQGEGGGGGEKEEKYFFSPPPPPSSFFALTPTVRVTIFTLPNLPLS